MSNTVKVKDIIIGEGIPKVCVPMVGRNLTQLKEEGDMLKNIDFDVVEWRADFFQDVEDTQKVIEALHSIREIFPTIPLLFTFRSAREGGEKEVTNSYYFSLIKEVVESNEVDLIDVELFLEEQHVKEIISIAHQQNVFVILSNHDFNKTPSKEEMISRLIRAQELGADILKIAVMPNSTKDVLTLLEATEEMYTKHATQPIITMAMGDKGVISRLSGEVFGSAMTFGAAKNASAPGQLNVADLKHILNLLHRSS
ncbi:type I 3-dehydroquinate dehydratase [Evansella tamaricis]|uniref:3-dehydroquinate dehydratase n=1 Tax=Evansella tamaricis TaxID=2069301 RepID=A0ABS6JIC5_9BACI|nr:type I 3-dehydroquinate dehydratase [Evansella tamaricis]MBU9712612.1 type I 3-dehydroquinate dehydratase [Evansella tamaricis]